MARLGCALAVVAFLATAAGALATSCHAKFDRFVVRARSGWPGYDAVAR